MRLNRMMIILLAAGLFLAGGCSGAEDNPTPPEAAAPSPTAPEPTRAATPAPTPTGTWITLDPQSGSPGETITLRGYQPGSALPNAQRNETALVCWDGCQNGLTYPSVPVTWSADQPGHFSLQLTLPATSWLGAVGQRDPSPGDYSVGVQCLGEVTQGCATQPAQATATFHLTGAAAVGAPPSPQLVLTPAAAAPGANVQVQGWAPLVEVSEAPIGYSLVIKPAGADEPPIQAGDITQKLDGTFTGQFQVPQFLPGQTTPLQPGDYTVALQAYRLNVPPGTAPLLVAPTTLKVTGAPGWASFQGQVPLWIAPGGGLGMNEGEASVFMDPKDPQRLAYCAAGEIRLSADGGASWSAVPVSGVGTAAARIGHSTSVGGDARPLQCLSVTLDSAHPDSLFAIFQTVNPQYGAPPVYFMGFFTSDAGKTWKLVPAPSQDQYERFGGFWSNGTLVQALFDGASPDEPVVLQTLDGGTTWNPAALTCPPGGACVRWGAHPGSIGGMGSPLPLPVMASFDGGKAWQASGPAAELRAAGPHELVALPANEVLLIDVSGQYPIQLSPDGGKTWTAIELPALPGAGDGSYPFGGLQMLPNGALIAQPQQNAGWMLLAPGAEQWCALSGFPLPKTPKLLTPAGDGLWWLPDGGDVPVSAPLAAFKCP